VQLIFEEGDTRQILRHRLSCRGLLGQHKPGEVSNAHLFDERSNDQRLQRIRTVEEFLNAFSELLYETFIKTL
jgi:hypothetical protein